jgi:transglutaminase-like putative cysteine protease
MTSLLSLALLLSAPPEPIRYEIAQHIELPAAPAEMKKARLWIPIPIDTDGQALLRLDVPNGGRMTREPTTGNRFLFLEYTKASDLPKSLDLRCIVRRSAVVVDEKTAVNHPTPSEALAPWLKPEPMFAATTDLSMLATKIAGHAKDPFVKGKAFYTHIFDNMTYDKQEPGWGEANVQRACDVGKGNCTDFHGLFVALCQTAKIPARLEMGLTLPIKDSASYHCWASFYAGRQGWTPVDISDPRKSVKDPKSASDEQRFAGFGKLTAERVVYGRGIEVPLAPAAEKPVRFVLFPVLEIDGVRVTGDDPAKSGVKTRWTSTVVKE